MIRSRIGRATLAAATRITRALGVKLSEVLATVGEW